MFLTKKAAAVLSVILSAPFFIFLSFTAQALTLQNPVNSYPYYEEKVVYEDKETGIFLSGTLTAPSKEGGFAAVILVSGAKSLDSNQEERNRSLFLALADHLTRAGFAVLRYDAYKPLLSGQMPAADLTEGAQTALQFLHSRKEIDKNKIGFLGHSDGANAVISAIAEPQCQKSAQAQFMVLLAPAGISGDKILLSSAKLTGDARLKVQKQERAQEKAKAKEQKKNKQIKAQMKTKAQEKAKEKAYEQFFGISKKSLKAEQKIDKGAYKILIKSEDLPSAKTELNDYLRNSYRKLTPPPAGVGEIDFMRVSLNRFYNKQTFDFVKYDPSGCLKKIKIPVFALWGQKDLQIAPLENFKAFKKAFKKNGSKNTTLKIYEDLNHTFQKTVTGLSSKDNAEQEPVNPEVLEDITQWINKQTSSVL
ncbi:MAG: hypothetical protein LBQ47_05710 [Endomicrobium sp.]|jgi:dienelactone hydrolase|nr:hypothetical protein [Endomicrobium sp.]